MSTTIAFRASHVNSGSAFPVAEVALLPSRASQLRLPKVHAEFEDSDSTALGGLALASRLLSKLGAHQVFAEHLRLLRVPKRYRDSDHLVAQVLSLFAGGSCLEDLARLQCSGPIRKLLGALSIPDPTTSGDFLRRFDEDQLAALDRAMDDLQRAAWKLSRGRQVRDLGIVDLDSHFHPVYGDKKEGTDFSYKGPLGYHPLIASLAGTGEVLRAINRPGNAPSAEGAAECLREIFPLLGERFRSVLVRGDSAFAKQSVYEACEDAGHHFAVVSPRQPNFVEIADGVPRRAWKPFRIVEEQPPKNRRKKRKEVRRRRCRERGKLDLRMKRQWVTEVDYRPARSSKTYRLIIRKQKIRVAGKDGSLFDEYRYRYVLSNLPKTVGTEEVVRLTYGRCDQEKVIEQLKNGVSAFRMPLGQKDANSAFLKIGALAHNLKAWLAQIVLPEECMRWEWKRFRYSFIYVAARVVRSARQLIVRFARGDPHTERIAGALARL